VSNGGNLDLSAFSYEEWIEFFFNRPVVEGDRGFVNAFCSEYETIETDEPETVIGYFARLCNEFGSIGSRYSLPQINQALWAMLLPFDLGVTESLWDELIPLEMRIECVKTMAVPYRDFVAGHCAAVMENCFDIWWDLVMDSFWMAAEPPFRGTELELLDLMASLDLSSVESVVAGVQSHGMAPREHDYAALDDEMRRLLDTALETLGTILGLPDVRCQQYALHGLGHLHHPSGKSVVQQYIDRHRSELDEQGLAWVEACRDGTVM